MVLQGDFDTQLQKASTEIRSKFSKKWDNDSGLVIDGSLSRMARLQ
jgi:hypothetical protein